MENFKIIEECPSDVTKERAIQDMVKEKRSQQGLMHCYCDSEFMSGNINFRTIDFTDIMPEETTLYCN